MPPDVRSGVLQVGFVCVSTDTSQCCYVCAVCRRVFYDLTDFQQDFTSHDMQMSTVSLPVQSSWLHGADEDRDITSVHKQLEIPLEAFVDYVNQYQKHSIIQTIKHIKSEGYESTQMKDVNGHEAEVSDTELTTTTVLDSNESQCMNDSTECVDKVCWSNLDLSSLFQCIYYQNT